MIYRNDGCYYKKIKVGTGIYNGMYLWKPVKKFLWFWVEDKSKSEFWLDDFGFEKI